ncbi:fungal-specific transcription factor domain-containing protein [Schizophyllum commune]
MNYRNLDGASARNIGQGQLIGIRRRSSRACDQCRKSKSRCERAHSDAQCKGCTLAGKACSWTSIDPYFKRGPPKGYIHAIEQRWHQVEALLGAIVQCRDPKVQDLVQTMRQDELACEIIDRVDMGPYGPFGKQNEGSTKEDFISAILRGSESTQGGRGSSRSRRQSRVPREVGSSSKDCGVPVALTKEWQGRLASRLAAIPARTSTTSDGGLSCGGPGYLPISSLESSGNRLTQRRRLGDSPESLSEPQPPNWSEMYTFDSDASDQDNAGLSTEPTGELSLDEHQEVRLHGKASGLHLLRRIHRIDDRIEGGIWCVLDDLDDPKLPMARMWQQAKDQVGASFSAQEDGFEVTMPPQDVQDELLELFFRHIHPIFPTIHKDRFLSEYNLRKGAASSRVDPSEISTGTTKPESWQKVNNLLLLSIFAITARFRGSAPALSSLDGNIWEAGCGYCDIASKILATRTFHHSQLSMVQSLLLLGYREFGIGSMHGWQYIGMAIRMAIDLGLNRDPCSWQEHEHVLFAPEEIQTRRQIWWTCVLADRYASMYMGRPIMIRDSDHDTQLPELELDEERHWQASPSLGASYSPMSSLSMAAFREQCRLGMLQPMAPCYTCSSTLGVIVGRILTDIYPARGLPTATKHARLVDIKNALCQWYLDLPDNLQLDLASSTRPTPPPHVLILHVHYWGAVLLLHRELATDQSQSTIGGTAFDYAQGAASHVSAIVDLIHERYSLRRTSAFLTAYLLASGTVNILALTVQPSNFQASLGLRQCLTALDEMQVVWPSASHAWDILNGVKLGHEKGVLPETRGEGIERNHDYKNAFDLEDRKSSDALQHTTLGTYGNARRHPSPQQAARGLSQEIMANMSGLGMPGIESSMSFCPSYEWWPRGIQESPRDVFGHPAELQQMPGMARPDGVATGSVREDQRSNSRMGWTQQDGMSPEVFTRYGYDVSNPAQYAI